MFISSTVLYFGENPVGYDLFKTEEGFELRPTPVTASDLVPPIIAITQSNEAWQVNGVKEEDLEQQVIKLIEINEMIGLPGKLSAAS